MKKWLKITFICFGIILVASFVWFDLFFWQENNSLFKNHLLESAKTSDVLIIFNSGGYGTVQMEKAYDFQPLIKGIEGVVNDLGYKASIVPYYRTRDSFLGKAAYLKELLFGFPKESDYLAEELQRFSKENPGKKIIIAGLSNGAGLVNITMEKIKCCQASISAIGFGTPFWSFKKEKPNIINFDNNGQDVLSQGNFLALAWATIKAPFVVFYSQIIGQPISFAKAINVPGHEYDWSKIDSEIKPFLSFVLATN